MFAKWARHYWEQGLNVIPVMGKSPVTKEWTKYATERQEEEGLGSLTYFEENYPSHGIGAVLGPSSGVMALDIDNPELLPALPKSTLIRGGGKGKTVHFFKYREDIKARSVPGLDIITTGRQVVLPPSPYPGDGKYEWLVGDGDFRELPELTREDEKKLFQVMLSVVRSQSQQTGEMVGNGRNNSLIRMAYAMACTGYDAEHIAKELLESQWASWFSDADEPHKGENPKGEAAKMAARMIRNAIREGDRLELGSGLKITGLKPAKSSKDEPKSPPPINVPMPDGILGDTMRAINDMNNADIWALALGGAVALWGAVLSNRFKFGRTWPNVFVLNLASSGTGKGAAYKLINKLLDGTDLAGYGAYKTLSSCVRTLGEKRERLDCIDEIGDLFNMMNRGGVFQGELIGGLCMLYTSSNDIYDGATTAEVFKEGKQTKFCNPCISLLGATTEVGMIKSATNVMSDKGLIPRFLLLRQNLGEYKPLKHPDVAPIRAAILSTIEKFPILLGEKEASTANPNKISLTQDSIRNSRDKWRLPRPLVCHSESEAKLVQAWEKENFETRRKLESIRDDDVKIEDPMLPIEARRLEITLKLALIYAATESLTNTLHMNGVSEPTFTGMTNYNGPRYVEAYDTRFAFTEHAQGAACDWVIKEKHLFWAKEVFEMSRKNFDIFALAMQREAIRDKQSDIVEFIEKRIMRVLTFSPEGFTSTVLRKKVSSCHRMKYTEVMRGLLEDGDVIEISFRPSKEAVGRMGKLYVARQHFEAFMKKNQADFHQGVLIRDL